jgi:hypothetical protein
MARERLSRLQRRILAWLVAEDQRLRGTMSASHLDLVRALVAQGVDKGQTTSEHYLPPWGMKPTVSDQRNLVDLHTLILTH